MTIECYNVKCKKHCTNSTPPDEGPFCYEDECQWEPLTPLGYTEADLEASNPYTQWERE